MLAQIHGLGLGALPHVAIQHGQIIQDRANVSVLGTQHCFANLQAAQVERLGLGVLGPGRRTTPARLFKTLA